jgi:hypothetical protein
MADTLVKALFTNFISSSGAVASHSYDTLPDNDQTALTANASADTFGSYAALATTVGSADVWLCGALIADGSVDIDSKVELATGASGSETAKIVMPHNGTTDGTWSFPYPLRVPSGTRLAGRVKTGDTTAATNDVVAFYATGLSG